MKLSPCTLDSIPRTKEKEKEKKKKKTSRKMSDLYKVIMDEIDNSLKRNASSSPVENCICKQCQDPP
jgi:hypothetical protein